MQGTNPEAVKQELSLGYPNEHTVTLLEFDKPLVSGRVYVKNEVTVKALEEYAKRVKDGTAFVEYGMPNVDHLTREQTIARMGSIDPRNVCGVVRSLTVGEASVTATIALSGPKRAAARSLINLNETPSFGMRAFTRPTPKTEPCAIEHIVSWDFIGTELKEQQQ